MSVLGLVVMQGGLTLTLGKPWGILNQPAIPKAPITINGQSEVLPILFGTASTTLRLAG